MRSSVLLLSRGGRPPLGIQAAALEARAHGGVCLSRTYKSSLDHLRWQCAEGHQWSTSLHTVKGNASRTGSWCPQCANARRTLQRQLARLEVATQEALSRGGWCLSKSYGNQNVPLEWRCSQGHHWQMPLRRIMKGAWCPVCDSDNMLEIAARIAKARGGSCLSANYVNSNIPIRWRCANGHEWCARPAAVWRGTWCKECHYNSRRLGLGAAVAIARQRGGQCLSTSFVNAKSALHWKCAHGHEWHVALNHVKYSDSWCPQCASGKTEQTVRSIFERIFQGLRFPNCRPRFLVGRFGRSLELDGYCESLNLAFEYNGEQHYAHDAYFNRKSGEACRDTFRKLLTRDELKASLCAAVGVKLVVVPYWVKDRWSFIRVSLLQWFCVAEIFPSALQS
ncbi:unnamed protein product [Prorocentrum cordatum]|uniref:Zinc-ribbon domain-containing protein n=1 Tax=Prorocentrum cordatum TaxID=2364126 RepID=A0ABN9Y773_9DINO|nr:unnamed protein product [Polarella glacialis]